MALDIISLTLAKKYTQEEIESIKALGPFNYKGSVANYEALPTSGQTKGDVWTTEDTGDEYVWTGDKWILFGPDMTRYYKKTEVDTLLNKKEEKKTLFSDGNAIYEDAAMTKTLTFVEVKAILDNPKYDVQLWNGNYILLPEYSTTQSGVTAIWFNGSTSLAGKTYLYRITINSDDQVINDEYQLINTSDVDSAMSATSTNPVQNKVVNASFYTKAQVDKLISDAIAKALGDYTYLIINNAIAEALGDYTYLIINK